MNTSNPIRPDDLFSARDLVIVITGGGSGIGLAFTSALAASGASKVFVLGRRLASLESAASQTNPSIVIPIQCDITSLDSVRSAVETIGSQTSHIDVLINNAGVDSPLTQDIKSASSITELSEIMTRGWDSWDGAWRTNTAAVVSVSAAFLPMLDKGNEKRGWKIGGRMERLERTATPGEGVDLEDRRTSQIVTVASISAFNREVTAGLAYTASKAGAVALGKSMANFLAPWGIRSNMIAPGRFPSDMTAGSSTEFPVNQVPQGSPGAYEDLASLILYLVGRSGAYLNGSVQVVDGGRLSVMPAWN